MQRALGDRETEQGVRRGSLCDVCPACLLRATPDGAAPTRTHHAPPVATTLRTHPPTRPLAVPQVTYHFLQCIFQHAHLTKGGAGAGGAAQGAAAPASGFKQEQGGYGGGYGGAPAAGAWVACAGFGRGECSTSLGPVLCAVWRPNPRPRCAAVALSLLAQPAFVAELQPLLCSPPPSLHRLPGWRLERGSKRHPHHFQRARRTG